MRPAVVLGDLTLVRPLAWAGVPVVAVTTDPEEPALRSRHVLRSLVVPGFVGDAQASAAARLRALGEALVAETGGPVPLFYGQDKQLELLYRYRRELEPHFLFLLNDEALAWSLLDKERFAGLCAQVGVRVPRTVAPAPGPEGVAAIRDLRPPLLVKPRAKVDWKGLQRALFGGTAKARVFRTTEALLDHPAFREAQDRLLVQEAIEGSVEDLVSFHGFAADDGRVLGAFCGRKVRTFPRFAGESAFIELVRDDELDALGRDVAARLGVRGPFKIDLVRDPRDGALYTLEVNARFTLWNHLGAAEGVNLLAVAYDYLVNGEAPEETARYEPRAHWLSFYRDVRGLREEWAAGDVRGVLSWAASLLRGPIVHETFDWRDPWPALHEVVGILRGKAQGLGLWRFTA
jgi:predicted ATP-grasp superfamily ATP-dependent carboligase